MNLYEKNIAALSGKGIILPTPEENGQGEADLKLAHIEAKNGSGTFSIEREGRRIFIHSKYNPQAEAEKAVSELRKTDKAIFVLFGIGYGYFARALLDSCQEKNKLIIFEGNPQILDFILHNADISDIINDERVNFFCDYEHLSSYLNTKINWINCYNITPYALPTYVKIIPDEIHDNYFYTRDIIFQKIINKNTAFHNSERWTKTLLNNLSWYLKSYNLADFEGLFYKKPIVIVSAGPSLDKNVELLKEIKGKVLIIAAFSAVKALALHGVEPDLMISIDSIQKGMGEYAQSIPLVYASTSNPELLEAHKGVKIFATNPIEAYTSMLLVHYGKKKRTVSVGGSVACMAVDTARLLGANRIILMGQDLAFSDKRIHAEGTVHKSKILTPEKMQKKIDNNSLMEVEDIFGGKVYTDTVMNSYRIWFENYFYDARNYIDVIDATEGGAKIKNTKIMPFREVIDKYFNGDAICDVESCLQNVYNKGYSFNKTESEHIFDDFCRTKTAFEKYAARLDEAVELCERLVKNCKFSNDLSKNNSILRRLDEIDSCLSGLEYNIELFTFMLTPILFDFAKARELSKDEKIDMAEKNLMKYQRERDISPVIIEYLEEAHEKIKQAVACL